MRRILLAVSMLALFPSVVRAGGFEFPSNGTVALGRGGAFTALANDLVALEYNPAGLLKFYNSVYLGDNFSSYNIAFTGYTYNPAYTYDETLEKFKRAESVSNQAGWQYLAPFLAASTNFGLKNFRLAIGLYGPSANGTSSFQEDDRDVEGLAVDRDPVRPHHYMMLDKKVSLAFYTLGLAYGKKDRYGIGLSLHWVDLISARFVMFTSSWWLDPEHSSDDYDVKADIQVSDRANMAFTLGGWVRPWHDPGKGGIEIGASVRGPSVNFKAKGTTEVSFFEGTLAYDFNEGGDLVIYGSDGNEADLLDTSLEFTYPMTARLGIRFFKDKSNLTPRWEKAWEESRARADERWELFDIELDVVWEGWSALDAYRISIDGYAKAQGDYWIETYEMRFKPVVVTKAYKDTWCFRLGGQVTPIPWLTLRLGGYYETGAVPLRYTNVDFASFNRFGLAAGLSLQWRFLRFSVAYSHVFQKDREVSIEETEVYKHYPLSEQEPEQDKLKVGAGTYETSYDIVSLALAFTF